jgi:hypothetical protein
MRHVRSDLFHLLRGRAERVHGVRDSNLPDRRGMPGMQRVSARFDPDGRLHRDERRDMRRVLTWELRERCRPRVPHVRGGQLCRRRGIAGVRPLCPWDERVHRASRVYELLGGPGLGRRCRDVLDVPRRQRRSLGLGGVPAVRSWDLRGRWRRRVHGLSGGDGRTCIRCSLHGVRARFRVERGDVDVLFVCSGDVRVGSGCDDVRSMRGRDLRHGSWRGDVRLVRELRRW